MNREMLGAIVELVGSIAVVASLVFVGFPLRQISSWSPGGARC